MSATIPEPGKLWGRDFDEVLGDNPEGALDAIVRRLLVQTDDITVKEVDAITAKAVAAGKAAILSSIAAESQRRQAGAA